MSDAYTLQALKRIADALEAINETLATLKTQPLQLPSIPYPSPKLGDWHQPPVWIGPAMPPMMYAQEMPSAHIPTEMLNKFTLPPNPSNPQTNGTFP